MAYGKWCQNNFTWLSTFVWIEIQIDLHCTLSLTVFHKMCTGVKPWHFFFSFFLLETDAWRNHVIIQHCYYCHISMFACYMCQYCMLCLPKVHFHVTLLINHLFSMLYRIHVRLVHPMHINCHFCLINKMNTLEVPNYSYIVSA